MYIKYIENISYNTNIANQTKCRRYMPQIPSPTPKFYLWPRQSFMSCRNIFSFLIILHKFKFLISFFFQRKCFTKGRAFQFFLMDSSSKRYTKGQADYSLVALRVREAYIRELKKVFN